MGRCGASRRAGRRGVVRCRAHDRRHGQAACRGAPVPDLKVEATPERIARGKAFVDGFCSACHSTTGTLTGGLDIGEDFPIPIGSFVSSNLTPAGRLKHWSDGEIFCAIRNGVDAHGRWLTLMSYTNAGSLSDDDTLAVIAWEQLAAVYEYLTHLPGS